MSRNSLSLDRKTEYVGGPCAILDIFKVELLSQGGNWEGKRNDGSGESFTHVMFPKLLSRGFCFMVGTDARFQVHMHVDNIVYPPLHCCGVG